MALELKIRVSSVFDDLTKVVIDDANNQLSTALQYGQGGNPLRSALGLFLYATQKNVGTTPDADVVVDNTDPENVSQWTLDYAEDSMFEYVLIAGNDYDGGTAYALNDIVYYSNALYICIQAGTGQQPDISPLYWTDVTTDPVTILGTGANFYSYTLNQLLAYNIETQYAKLIADKSKNGQCLICDEDEQKRIDRANFHIQAAKVAWYQGLVNQAGYNITTLKDMFNL